MNDAAETQNSMEYDSFICLICTIYMFLQIISQPLKKKPTTPQHYTSSSDISGGSIQDTMWEKLNQVGTAKFFVYIHLKPFSPPSLEQRLI